MTGELPEEDGVILCRELLKTVDVPLLIMSGIHSREDKMLCIGNGAEEYLEKPLRPADVLYRVRRLKKKQEERKREEDQKLLRYRELLLADGGVYVHGRKQNFTNREYDLLLFFLTHRDRIYSKGEIFESVWKEPASNDTGCVTTYINSIRMKLSKYDLNPIKTVRTKGYITEKD